jgi:hypothetical protein
LAPTEILPWSELAARSTIVNMKIIKPTDGLIAAERRLTATMLNIEHGALAYSPNLEPIAPPHAPWPTISVPPITQRGLPTAVHYRPSVGIVFYTKSERFDIKSLVDRLAAQLGQVSDSHLKLNRVAAASPTTVVRQSGQISGGNLVTGPRKCFKKVVPVGELPSRILMWTPETETELPLHFSLRAAFTWVFMPVMSVIGLTSFLNMSEVNAMVASIFYDAALISSFNDNDESFKISLKDFDLPPAPKGLDLSIAQANTTPNQVADRRFGAGAIVVDLGTGAMEFVGHHYTLDRDNFAMNRVLASVPWEPEKLILRLPGCFQCTCCNAPIGGPAVVVSGLKTPTVRNCHRTRHHYWCGEGASIFGEVNNDKWMLICMRCATVLDRTNCLTSHMGAQVRRTVVPMTQAESAAACPGYESVGVLLRGTAARIPGLEAALRVLDPRDGSSYIIAGAALGRYPMLTCPEISSQRLPVIAGLRIAVLTPGPQPQPRARPR